MRKAPSYLNAVFLTLIYNKIIIGVTGIYTNNKKEKLLAFVLPVLFSILQYCFPQLYEGINKSHNITPIIGAIFQYMQESSLTNHLSNGWLQNFLADNIIFILSNVILQLLLSNDCKENHKHSQKTEMDREALKFHYPCIIQDVSLETLPQEQSVTAVA